MKNLRNIFFIISLVLLCFGLGVRYGQKNATIVAGNPGTSSSDIIGKTTTATSLNTDFSQFWEVWDLLSKNYMDKSVINPQKMVYGAISGMVASLGDPYTMYLPPTENKESKDDLSGTLEGIGAQLGVKDKKIVVIAPIKGSPAEKAGLKPGDWIAKVDGKETYDWTIQEAISKIRGKKGTQVALSIVQKDETSPKEVKITRDAIQVASVEWEMKTVQCMSGQCKEVKEACPTCKKIAYLKLTRFGEQTNTEWEKAINEILTETKSLSDANFRGVILDVRNNPGGYLKGAVFIGSEFLKDGTVVMQQNANGSKENLDVDRTGKLLTVPLTVLINKGSASASEIVAGALHDRKRATLVGETSFGKGTIQQAMDLNQGAGIHITTAKWLTPNGTWVHGTGVKPDVSVENDAKEPHIDLQLEKAYTQLVK